MDNKNIIIPDGLIPGDAIGIVAPASPFDEKKLEAGISIIESMGFQVEVPEGILNPNGYLSAKDADRAEQLNRYFADKRIKAILCARGGYGSIRILRGLDYDLIRKNPKIFIGFSDVTVLLTSFYRKCDLAVFHGPMAAGLSDMDTVTLDSLKTLLTTIRGPAYALDDCNILKAGRVEGPLIGGNLTSLCHLIGTPYGMKARGHILFLEDRGEETYRIDRMLMHLKLAGGFNGIKGLILGSFEDCGNYEEISGLAEEILSDVEIPIIAGFVAGHGGTNLILPMGIPALLDTDIYRLEFYN